MPCSFDPNGEIVGPFTRCRRRRTFRRTRQTLPRFLQPRWRTVKRQLRQRHPGFGRACVLREFPQKFLERRRRLALAASGLRESLLEK